VLLTVDTTVVGDAVVVRAAGEIDLHTAPLLDEPVREAVESASPRVVVDLSQTRYLDSTGLAVLLGAHQQLRAAGRSLVLRTSQPGVLRLLGLAGLTRLMTVEPEPEAGAAGA